MSTVADAPTGTTMKAVIWKYIPGVPQIAALAQVDGIPVGVAERSHDGRFHAKLVSGNELGTFSSMDGAQAAIENAVG